MSIGVTRGVALRGITGHLVDIECHVGRGLPAFDISGLPDAALRQAISQLYPEVVKFELTDYKVRILDADHGTDAITRVLIETADGETSWVTVCVGANVIEASWGALVDGLTFGLRRHQGDDDR